MGYEDAPATKMVATHCACCNRPLVDSVSVECGVGPICRGKYKDEWDTADEDSRKAANKLIYEIAAHQDGPEVVERLKGLFELGFPKVVQTVLKRVAKIQIAETGEEHPHGAGRLAVKAPYRESALLCWREVPGSRWDGKNKVRTFPMQSKLKLWECLQKHYAGLTGVGPKGPFIVPNGRKGRNLRRVSNDAQE